MPLFRKFKIKVNTNHCRRCNVLVSNKQKNCLPCQADIMIETNRRYALRRSLAKKLAKQKELIERYNQSLPKIKGLK